MIHENIKEGIKEAMKAKDSVRLETLRGVATALTNELVAKGKTPQDMIGDEDAIAVITRLAKQRRDSISQFKAGGREDLVAEEEAQLSILEAFLPTLMSREEILPIAQAKKEELGITDKTKAGQLTGALMKDLKGQADGGVVKEVVESLF
ncbi:MAG: GatB/YqeY domain-containing protein [Candidatus Pacebacteria bacterium]|nr:GatB/YqeY domain-containing protein [Candidatus Paceibacterota bacterium]MBP9852232.1 GatB/YqeY domain-containing protein [Candidatus Paceibacterota bacterium]